MKTSSDEIIWSTVARHLADVEAFIPAPKLWRAPGEAVRRGSVRVVAGRAFGRAPARSSFVPRRAVWAFAILCLALALVGAVLLAGALRPTAVDVRSTGSMSVHRYDQSATLLADGRVLVIGGADTPGNLGFPIRASAEIYDPTTGAFSPTGSMRASRDRPVATRLLDGRVLVLGGGSTSAEDKAAELYDPTTGAFVATGSLSTPRFRPSATLLRDGRVLITGGTQGNGPLPPDDGQTSAELFDPASGTFSLTGSMTTARSHPVAILLDDGRVLVTGSQAPGPWAELYDPATGTFSPTGNPVTPRDGHDAVLLNDGRVLILAGNWPAATTAAEVFDPASGQFHAVGSIVTPSLFVVATRLPDGHVLVTGGDATPPYAVELFDPATEQFSEIASRVTTPAFSSATLLADGDVLVAGGWVDGVSLATTSLLNSMVLETSPRP